ncbi:MAG: adenylate kinase [Thermoplasmata archaeon]|nr:adenylate kinase [Thermoplasmata archaeon]MCI4337899.1 adenylate kinase [Thermoplasmata archaeon]MCI4340787.1 adenylate kinase [Thermoplasmata archaeon]
MPRVVLLGPPGAGKGTQAGPLAAELGVPHLSTGDLLRAAVAKATSLGAEADGYMRAGHLVPDELVLRILRARLSEPDARAGFVLDGYPRNRAQAETLAALVAVDDVLYFELPEEVLLGRLTQRRSCPRCGRVYNLSTRPPRSPGRCDVEGAELLQRSDDRPEAVRVRLATYREQTEPLLQYYAGAGLLRRLDALGSTEEVGRRLRAALRLPNV